MKLRNITGDKYKANPDLLPKLEMIDHGTELKDIGLDHIMFGFDPSTWQEIKFKGKFPPSGRTLSGQEFIPFVVNRAKFFRSNPEHYSTNSVFYDLVEAILNRDARIIEDEDLENSTRALRDVFEQGLLASLRNKFDCPTLGMRSETLYANQIATDFEMLPMDGEYPQLSSPIRYAEIVRQITVMKGTDPISHFLVDPLDDQVRSAVREGSAALATVRTSNLLYHERINGVLGRPHMIGFFQGGLDLYNVERIRYFERDCEHFI